MPLRVILPQIDASQVVSGKFDKDDLEATANKFLKGAGTGVAMTEVSSPSSKTLAGFRRTGAWHSYVMYGNIASGAGWAADRLYANPMYIGAATTITKIGCRVSTAGAGGAKIRLGIYDNGNCYPANLLLDAGEVAGDSTGHKEIAGLSLVVNADTLIWLACFGDDNATEISVYDNDDTPNIMGGSDLTMLFTSLYHAQAYGALPDPFPSSSPAYNRYTTRMVGVWLT